jgi:protein arginine N-methyltransferase 1
MRISAHRNYYELHSPDRDPNSVFALLRTHELMLSDLERLEAYRDAIRRVVKPGDVVLDLGSGLGILALFAAEAGAERVYAIEQFGNILNLARRVGNASPWANRLRWIRDHSTQVLLPEKVDVVVTETLGHFGVEEGIVPSLANARRRFLKRGGVLIPSRLRLFLAPVESAQLYETVSFWRKPLLGLNFSPVASAAAACPLLARVPKRSLLSEGKAIAEFQLGQDQPPRLELRSVLYVRNDGVVHGLGGWFSARLARGVEIANEPETKHHSWHQVFFPVERALRVSRSCYINVTLCLTVNEATGGWKWHVETDEHQGRLR